MSDLHLSFRGSKGLPPLAQGADAVLIAGDICEGLAPAVEVLRPAYPEPTEIVIVAGNHEYHSRNLSFQENLAQGREAAARHRIRLLERDVCLLGKIRIVGCTMWTEENVLRFANAPAVAAKLMLARAVDARKGLAASIRTGAPIVAIDVADPFALEAVGNGLGNSAT